MMNNIKEWLKANWKPVVWGLVPFLIIIIVFALPLRTVPIQVTETYWDTEMKDEAYTVPETYTTTEPYTATETKTDTVFDGYINASNWSHTVDAKKPNSTVSISIYGFSYPQYIYWNTDIRDRGSYFLPWPYGDSAKVVVKISYPEDVIKYNTVTKTRDVVKHRQVPTQVMKERKVTQYLKMSIWAYLFFEPPK
jgi:hypothetical protein